MRASLSVTVRVLRDDELLRNLFIKEKIVTENKTIFGIRL